MTHSFTDCTSRLHQPTAVPATGSQPHLVPVDELLTPSFLSRHTRFADFASFAVASGLTPIAMNDLETGRGSAWDTFVSIASDFPDWGSMLRAARSDWVMKRLGIVVDA